MEDAKTILIEQSMENIKKLESILCKFKTDLSSDDFDLLSHVCMSSEVLCAYISTSLYADVIMMYKHYERQFNVDNSVAH